MLIVSRPWSVRIALVSLAASLAAVTAFAQQKPVTFLDRQLPRFDLGLTASGQLTTGVTGTNYLHQTITADGSTTVGLLATLRYTYKPLIGFEGNFSQSRYTENFTNLIGGSQTKVNEETLGYVAHLPQLFTAKPFAGIGLGTLAFHPTAAGGQGLPFQYRAVYYYNVGFDQPVISPNFGLRLAFREIFFKAPDFGQNYLTIQQHTTTFEPTIGFFLRF